VAARALTWTAGLGKYVYLAERIGIDLYLLGWSGVCYFDFGKGGLEEMADGFWAVFACVLATVNHGPYWRGSVIVRSTHCGG
jgi:hypothetical protein